MAFPRKFPTISSCLGKETTSLFSNWKTLLNLLLYQLIQRKVISTVICVPLQEGFKYFLPAYYPRPSVREVKDWEFYWQRSLDLNDYNRVWFCNQIRNTARYLLSRPGNSLLSLSIMLWSAYMESITKFWHSDQIWTDFPVDLRHSLQ